jgi:radical SAM protein with 4Fe4S-binding SPASM domain
MQEKEFCGGNLRETAFKDIWDNAVAFNYFRRLEPEACRKCPRFNNCRGGCPAVAYFVSRDLNKADPECLINWSRDVSAVSPIL